MGEFFPTKKSENFSSFHANYPYTNMHRLKSSQRSKAQDFASMTQTGEKTAIFCLAHHDWILLSTVILPIQSFIFANQKFQLIEKSWNSYTINTEMGKILKKSRWKGLYDFWKTYNSVRIPNWCYSWPGNSKLQLSANF